ncbi:MAG TPA: HAD-IC family P-type ATPase, partial [Acidimicrobiia bacterium]|nr:HAD-IC family P-type ATPase [Acidimicrobiia bacterium]
EAHQVYEHDARLEQWEHPADPDRLLWGAVALGADAVGTVLGVAARAARLPRLPIEVAAALPALDNLPPVRRVLEGRRGVEAGVVSVAALLQGLGQGPVGLAVDAGHRVLLLREAAARRSVWQRVEPGLHRSPRDADMPPLHLPPRPRPVPDGVVERYAQRVSLGSLGLGAVAVAVQRNPRALADVIIAAIPRPARLGREAFAAELGYRLSARDVLVMDSSALRRLDRIDTVVVDYQLLEQTSAGSRALVTAIRSAAQDFVVAGGGPGGCEWLEPDATVAGDDDLATSVRQLQDDGRVVAVVSRRPGAGLAAADFGMGVIVPDETPPWGADVLCPNLHMAALMVDATAVARTASRRAVAVAAAGSTLAAGLVFVPVQGAGAGRRTVLASNFASLVALGTGAWTAATFMRRPLPPDDAPEVAWHALTPEDVSALLSTSTAGLSSGAIDGRRADDHTQRGPSFPMLLTQELANPLTLLLAAGGALSTLAGSVTDGVLITGVLGVNAVVGAAQRLRTEEAIGRLGASVSKRLVRIRRDGVEHSVPPGELVDGDLLVLQAGDVVPADSRIVRAVGLEADESALTGESLPVPKGKDAVAFDAAVADRASMVYSGTAIAAGRGDAIVVATGAHTEARRGIAEGDRAPATGVEIRLENLSRKTVPVVLAAGGLLTGSALLRGVQTREAVSTGVSLAAAAVPEGLPFLATVAQSGAARRLARQGVLVRNARVLEALGRADVLCFDKTGTLTEGRLQLRSVSDGDVAETMPAIEGARCLVLAAALRATPRARGRELPHPTDQAIVDGAAALELRTEFGAEGWHKIASLPFAPSRGYHAVLGEGDTGALVTVKGAPEVVLPRCGTWRRGDEVIELDQRQRLRLERRVERFARQGLRVLAVAERHTSGRGDLDDARIARLELLGFVMVADATRSDAIAPIAQLQRAGIAVVMLTGDHPSTAHAIASELGLLDGEVVSGLQLDELADEALEALLEHATVFARVTPAHKVRIVQAFQRRGRVVAMTGDGANDAQAIRLADIGIAFGPRATPAARGAADLVVVDDRVETLITAIIEGRAMWASVRDALALLLGGNLGEVIFTTGVGLVTGRSPLNARQLLAVNLLTDLAPAMAIALQPPLTRDVDLRREGPDTSLGSALARDVAVRAAATATAAGAAWTVARFTGTPARARTVALAALVGAQLGQTIVIGHRSPLVLGSGVLSVGALVGIVQTPGVSQFFGCRPLGPVGWTIAASAAGAATAGAAVAGFVLGRTHAATATPSGIIDLRQHELIDEPGAAARPAV